MRAQLAQETRGRVGDRPANFGVRILCEWFLIVVLAGLAAAKLIPNFVSTREAASTPDLLRLSSFEIATGFAELSVAMMLLVPWLRRAGVAAALLLAGSWSVAVFASDVLGLFRAECRCMGPYARMDTVDRVLLAVAVAAVVGVWFKSPPIGPSARGG